MVGFTERGITDRQSEKKEPDRWGVRSGAVTRAVSETVSGKRKYPWRYWPVGQVNRTAFRFLFLCGARWRLPAQDMRGLGTALA